MGWSDQAAGGKHLSGDADLVEEAPWRWGCAPASTWSGNERAGRSGRREPAARTRASRSQFGFRSTLNWRMSCASARSISSAVFPTPEKTILRGSAPARRTRYSSPPETMSKPAPRRPEEPQDGEVQFAFTAKQVMCGKPAKARSKAVNCRSSPDWL